MKIGIIVQTRMGSTRLPGKVLMKADEKNVMLDYSINQLKNCKNFDGLVIATSKLQRDDKIEEHCNSIQIDCFRGDEADVLSRHYLCAKQHSFTHIIRIPSDKPLIDPKIVDEIIDFFIKNQFDYVANFEIYEKNQKIYYFIISCVCRSWILCCTRSVAIFLPKIRGCCGFNPNSKPSSYSCNNFKYVNFYLFVIFF